MKQKIKPEKIGFKNTKKSFMNLKCVTNLFLKYFGNLTTKDQISFFYLKKKALRLKQKSKSLLPKKYSNVKCEILHPCLDNIK